jgi:beta-mannanase
LISLILSGCAATSGAVARGGATAVRPVVPASGLLDPSSGKFFGIEAGGAPDSMGPVDAVAAEVGQTPNLIGQFLVWNQPFDAPAAANTLNSGALYFISWQPFGISMSAIAAGASDRYIAAFARAVRAFGKPVAITFGHEFNGHWYPWSTTGTTPARFVAAWRHIHDLFAAAGAANVIWIWDPNIINLMPHVKLRPFWPGGSYVDWVGLTGYFSRTGPHTFAGIYGPTMTEIREFTSKPFIIAETSVQTGPDQAESVRNLVNGVKERSDVLGFIWFNYNKDGIDWTVGGRLSVREAMAGALSGMRLADVDQ